MSSVRIRVLFFGVIRDVVGLREDTLDIAEGGNLGSVFEHYAGRFPRLRGMAASTVLALKPPVSGGSGYLQHIADPAGNFYALTREPIDGTAIARKLLREEDGAFVNFEGVTRNNTKGRATRFLEYECYEAMAVRTMAEIGADIARNH